LLHNLPAPATPFGEVYIELYLNEPGSGNEVGLYRSGTRILKSLTAIEALQRPPWTENILQGIVDAPFLHLTPATRTGVIHDAALDALLRALAPVEARLMEIIEEQKRAEEERTSRETLRAIQRAFREALLTLPAEEYDWFDIHLRQRGSHGGPAGNNGEDDSEGAAVLESGEATGKHQKQFFEYAGPLFSVRISPGSCTLAVGQSRAFHAIARDRARNPIPDNVAFAWRILQGEGRIEETGGEFATYHAPEEPGLARLGVTATQGETGCDAEALVTVTDALIPEFRERPATRHGLPGYTFEHAPGVP